MLEHLTEAGIWMLGSASFLWLHSQEQRKQEARPPELRRSPMLAALLWWLPLGVLLLLVIVPLSWLLQTFDEGSPDEHIQSVPAANQEMEVVK